MSGECSLRDGSLQPKPKSFLEDSTLELLGIKDPGAVNVITDWHRGGSETYIKDFVVARDGNAQHLIAKACIKFNPVDTVQEWVRRRFRLQNAGVIVPELLATDGANIVEEYIPYDLKCLFSSSDKAKQEKLRDLYVATYTAILRCGFNPLSLHDLRSHGEDLVVVDFGEDLGGYSVSAEGQEIPDGLAERSFERFIG